MDSESITAYSENKFKNQSFKLSFNFEIKLLSTIFVNKFLILPHLVHKTKTISM